jgi:hypothetical protein
MKTQLHSRREVLIKGGLGFSHLALLGLLGKQANGASGSEGSGVPATHHPAQAKRVLFLFMGGGPSHHDTFDYKPDLARTAGQPFGTGRGLDKRANSLRLEPQFQFQPRGESGLHISDAFPHLAEHADDLCLLNGMYGVNGDHSSAMNMMFTGSANLIRPSMGSWFVYGLGSESEELPGFVAVNSKSPAKIRSAFLPSAYRGTAVTTGKEPIANITPAFTKNQQQRQIAGIKGLHAEFIKKHGADSQLDDVVRSYEMGFLMQRSVPEVMDWSGEPQHIQTMYGIDNKETAPFGESCLAARRLLEAGVRFVQVSHGNWDHHNNVREGLTKTCGETDLPIAGLLQDLKQRGMLKDTLIVWGGEFGRSPFATRNGRGHNPRGFTMWMAGGGAKGGFKYGETDELGDHAVVDRMNIHDLHATMLHLMGMNHERLTFRYSGRDFRLTDVAGDVAHDVIS